MPFTANMSGTTELDDRLIKLYAEEFHISAADTFTKGLDTLVTQDPTEIKGASMSFTIYSKLARQTSALTEDEDATSEAMADSEVLITPAEYGNTVQRTNLVDLQSGGMVTRAALRLAGINAAESQENKLVLVGEAGTNDLFVGQSAENALTASDTLSKTYVNRAFNKLERAGIPKIDGAYWAVAHPDCIHDLREETGDGSWVGTNQYQNSREIRDNEIGMYGGFRWISHPMITVNANAGASAVDTYHNLFFGYNAFGKATSQKVGGVVTGPFDKLGRFLNVGWYGVYEYGIVDAAALWKVTAASSIGTN